MKTSKVYNNRIPSDINCICRVIKEIVDFLQNYFGAVEENSLFELKVILNELLLNAIKHGNKEQFNKYVKITAGIDYNHHVYLIIEDQGEGYNYTCLEQSNLPCDEILDICNMKETGRGILIVKNLCDNVRFNKRGNKIVIIKSI